uniref:CDP-diacylglycerol--inositol 3-phosphatidyltransferase-like isoform X2 n=1 Tax=Myxine glutinosa TaxID=7769 RepID=UPI00358ECFBE
MVQHTISFTTCWGSAKWLQGYVRIAFAVVAFCIIRDVPGTAVALYLASFFLDEFDGIAARAFNQESRFGAMLDMLTDRCATACLIVNLALLYPSATPLFQLSLSLDLASHWLHTHSSVLKSNENHKIVGGSCNWLIRMYYNSHSVMSLICTGNELFYCCLLLCYHYSGPSVPGIKMGLYPLLVVTCAPVALLKAVISLMQLLSASADITAMDCLNKEKKTSRD